MVSKGKKIVDSDFAVNIIRFLQTVKRTQQNAQKRLEEEKEKKDLVQQVAETHSNSQRATERVKKFKQSSGTHLHVTPFIPDFRS